MPKVNRDSGDIVDLKAAFSMKPEQRAKWLSKACRMVESKAVSASQLYDVVTSRKIVTGLSDRNGGQMLRILQENLELFSEKQQRYLTKDSPFAQFSNKNKDASSGNTAGQAHGEDDDKRSRPAADEDAASRMEEMMARCRNFVREKASTFEDRQQQVEREERRRTEEQAAREKAEAERRHKEWELWERSLVIWERSQMTAMDERTLQQNRESEIERKAAELREEVKKSSSSRTRSARSPSAKAKKRRSRSGSSGTRVSSDSSKSKPRAKSRRKESRSRSRTRQRTNGRRK